MKKLILLISVFILIPFTVFAGPTITGGDTALTDGQESSWTGAEFGVNTGDKSWTGDNIDAAADGSVFSMSSDGWESYVQVEANDRAVARITDQKSHNPGGNAIEIDWLRSGAIQRLIGHFYQDLGSQKQRIFLTYWLWSGPGDFQGTGSEQRKLFGFNTVADPNYISGNAAIFASSQSLLGTTYFELTRRYLQDDNGWYCDGCPLEQTGRSKYITDPGLFPAPEFVTGRWAKVVMYIDVGTTDNNDGTFMYYLHDPDDPGTPGIRFASQAGFDGNLAYLVTGTGNTGFSHILIGKASTDGLGGVAWHDDIYSQVGSFAHVELGNASTIGACTFTETQIESSRSDGLVNFTVNQGNLPDGTAWGYVYDDGRLVNSAGFEVVLGAASTGVTATGMSFKGVSKQ